MTLTIVLLGLIVLVICIGIFGMDAFISFFLVALGIGLMMGLDTSELVEGIMTGIGDTLGFLVPILGFGAMLGKMVAKSGAAQRIAYDMTKLFPETKIQWALVLTGFIVGIPMFYSVGFVILVPLVFTIAASTRLPLLYVGLPMLAALSVTHGYLPPHPAPSAIVETYGADMGRTLLYGLAVAIPAIILGGPLFSRTLKNVDARPLPGLLGNEPKPVDQLPGLAASLMTALLPVLLLGFSTILLTMLPMTGYVYRMIKIMNDPVLVMFISILVAIYTLGLRRGLKMKEITEDLGSAVASVAVILLIIAGAGALKQVLVITGISDDLGSYLTGFDLSPIVLAWGLAAFIRVCVGSATVAALTSAGIVLPMIQASGADPNLMVLATGAGSLMFSHVNDGGFWLFKEFFQLTISQTLRTWSVMETIVSVSGLFGVLILDLII